MSLRKPRGEVWETPISPEKFAAGSNAAHQFMQCGLRGWRCACGMIYSGVTNRSEAHLRHHMHQKEVIQSVEDNKNGNDRYADE